MNGGIVVKTNAKQRYATDAISTFIVKQLVEKKGGSVQEFEARNDMCVYMSFYCIGEFGALTRNWFFLTCL